MDNWEIARSSGVCSASGRPIEEGEEYYVVILEDGESFRREDYSLEAWTGPPTGAFCHFKSRIPPKTRKKRLFVDDDLLVNFFLRLADEADESRLRFRFVLGLILMRKRLLRYQETIREDGREYWQMCLAKDRSMHRVLNPQLTDDQVGGVSQQLGAILHGDMGDFTEEAEACVESADAATEDADA